MKKTIVIFVSLFIFLGLGGLYCLNNQQDIQLNQKASKLELMGDECLGISEKAIVNLTAVVEFQKLEILSRKANVMKRCMADRGFQEDTAWRKYQEPIAKIAASKQNISFDEAIENQRKVDMWVFKRPDQQPLYWALINK